jgi:hypothetical protein
MVIWARIMPDRHEGAAQSLLVKIDHYRFIAMRADRNHGAILAASRRLLLFSPLECGAISFFKVNRTSGVCDILSVVEMSGRRDRRSKLFPQAIGTGHRPVQKPDEVQGSQSVVGHSAA